MTTDRPDQPPPPPGSGPPEQPTQPAWNAPPPQPPQQGWGQPQQGYPLPGPGYAPPGYGYPPPGYGMPAAKGGLNPIGRIASVLLIVLGGLYAFFGALVFLTGAPGGLAQDDFSGPIVPNNTVAGLVVVLFFVGVVELLVGIFAFAGKEWARWMGVGLAGIFAVLWLLLMIVGAGMGMDSVIVLLFVAANVFIVIALSAAWRLKPR